MYRRQKSLLRTNKMAAIYVPSTATLVNVATTSLKTIVLPPSYERAGRIITIKDTTGQANSYPITISTQGTNTFDGGSNLYTISYPYSAVTFISRTNQWLKTGTSEPTISTPTVSITGVARIYSDLFVSGDTYIQGTISSQTVSTIYGLIENTSTNVSTTLATGLSTVALFTSNTSNYFILNDNASGVSSLYGEVSTGFSTLALFTSNSSNYLLPGVTTNISASISTATLYTSNTSNFFLPTLLNNLSSGLSSVALFTSNTSNSAGTAMSSMYGIVSTGLSTNSLFTSNTSNYFANLLLYNISSSLSNTSNYFAPLLLTSVSSGLSSVALFTSNTSNYMMPAVTYNISASISTATLYTSNTSNFLYPALLNNLSSGLSSVALFTSNTSNSAGTAMSSLFGITSSGLSSVALFTSNTSNIFITTILPSTIDGLGKSGYISSQQLTSTVGGLQTNVGFLSVNISTLSASNAFISSLKADKIVSITISTWQLQASSLQGDGSLITNIAGLSTVALFTSNTSNSAGTSMSSLFGVTSTGFSTIALFTSNTSNFFLPALSNNYSTNLESTVIGLGTSGYISSSQLVSTVFALQSNISSFIDPTELTSTIIGLGTFGYFSTIGVYSTVTGLYNYIQADIGSTIVGLGSAGFVSTFGLTSTTQGILTTTTQISNYYAPTLSNNLSSGLSSIALALTSTTQSFSLQFITSTITADTFIGNGANLFALPAISSLSLQSTVVGLGSASYISSASLTSSFIGLGTFGYKSTLSNVPLVSSIQLQASSFTGNLADAFTLLIMDL